MYTLDNLRPERVFHYFKEISAIPHGSFHTDEISNYLVEYAKTHNLKYRQDNLGNVIIWKDGKGKPVIIQGHMDMVCEKAPDCDKDMLTEGLDLYVEGDKLKARGTTLGGDDGIAVAMALAVLEMDDDKLPPIEAIITVNEEVGMLGAAGIDVSDVMGRTMLNIDSEEEGVFTVSCAGGVVAKSIIPVERDAQFNADKIYRISISKLIGGHSGIEIHKNRANAIRLLGRTLQRLNDDLGIRIIDINGGAKDNAIAISAEATIAIDVIGHNRCGSVCLLCTTGESDASPETILDNVLEYMRTAICAEFSATDPDISISCETVDSVSLNAMSIDSTNKVIYLLNATPNGIQRMSPEVKGLVQTSLNMGILSSTNEEVMLTLCLRSSVASEKDELMRRLRDITRIVDGRIEFEGNYPGWQYMSESPLRDLMVEIFKKQYGNEPVIEAIHAGVECGYFASKLPGLDCVSFGPNLTEIHTFRESMDIPSVERTYNLVLELLYRLAER